REWYGECARGGARNRGSGESRKEAEAHGRVCYVGCRRVGIDRLDGIRRRRLTAPDKERGRVSQSGRHCAGTKLRQRRLALSARCVAGYREASSDPSRKG